MKRNSTIAGLLLAGAGAWLVGCFVQGVMQRNHLLATRKLSKQANNTWEGEGGTIIDPAPRPNAS